MGIAVPALPTSSTSPGPAARDVVRGTARLLADMGYAMIPEFVLASGRRADIAGVDGRGRIVLVEVKVSLADFRGDGKWPDYLEFCDRFFFAVPPEFPRDPVDGPLAWPERTGLIVADRFGGARGGHACQPASGRDPALCAGGRQPSTPPQRSRPRPLKGRMQKRACRA